ncbi:glycosyltransferase family 2 protein [Haloarcula amylovorans]|uniref:glycosyltransferase family 2 protein n=1 Tax=Haloarcula amylovorans TaxID=2562280 RepID=UPI0010765795|nr:glycosyltransferase family 2 protein [Halomicroarcula amylolytica]
MARPDNHQDDTPAFLSSGEPAVGILASDEYAEWVAGEIIRARRSGHQVFVAGTGDTERDWQMYARALDATILEQERRTDGTVSLRQQLRDAAWKEGFPGLIVHTDSPKRIDLERSIEELQATDSYTVDAYVDPPVSGETTVLAGIPAYNEENTIEEVVTEAAEYVDEVLVVDDGSDDRTALAAKAAGAAVVEHDYNRGYGSALNTLFEQASRARVDHLVVLDADSQHDPADIPKLADSQHRNEAEIVVGSRFVEDGTMNAPFYRRVGLMAINSLTNISHGAIHPRSWIRDTQSGFRAYSRKAIQSLASDDAISARMSASTDILNHARRNGYSVKEVGTTVDYAVDGANCHHPLSHGFTLVNNLFQTAEVERPLSVLGIPGFVSWFGGLGFASLCVVRYTSTGRIPLLFGLLAGLLTLTGLVACFTASILYSLPQQ